MCGEAKHGSAEDEAEKDEVRDQNKAMSNGADGKNRSKSAW